MKAKTASGGLKDLAPASQYPHVSGCYNKDSMKEKETYHLLDNSRFYILASSFLLSLAVLAYLRLELPNDQVFSIRLQQAFGLLCVLYWYSALIISPLGYVIGKHRMRRLEFARRAIGVSAFYFALLHGLTALFGQLGGFSQLAYLPAIFKWSLTGGLIAMIILLLLAMTSFDAVIKCMTFRRWKWLHRLIYIGGILAMLHVWTIGTHMAYGGVQAAVYGALVVLIGLELYRITKLVNDKHLHFRTADTVVLCIAVWAVVAALLLAVPTYIQNYHSRHHNSASAEHGGHQ